MKKEEIQALLKSQREFFDSGKTIDVKFRISMLKKLYEMMLKLVLR